MTSHAQFRRMGWIAFLVILAGLAFALHVKVQAVHSDVVRAERKIVALEQEKLLLTTEFETRASQIQLAAWNRVDFGFVAPSSRQFLAGERQLAALGVSGLPGVGAEVQFARGEAGGESPKIVLAAAEPSAAAPLAGPAAAAADRLAERQAAEAEFHLATVRLDAPSGRIALAALTETAAAE